MTTAINIAYAAGILAAVLTGVSLALYSISRERRTGRPALVGRISYAIRDAQVRAWDGLVAVLGGAARTVGRARR